MSPFLCTPPGKILQTFLQTLFFHTPKRGYWALECVLKLQQYSGSSKNRYQWYSAIAIYILHHAWEISTGHFDRLFGHVIVCYPTEAYYGYKMILAGFHSLNQRLFLVTLAPANPPREGRAKRVRNAVPYQGDQNPKMTFYKGGNNDQEPQVLEFSNLNINVFIYNQCPH